MNKNHVEEALKKLREKKDLKKINIVKLDFESNVVLFCSKNLTPFNQQLAWKYCELKCAGEIHISWSSNGVAKLRWIMNEKYCMIIKLLIILTLSSKRVKVKIEIDKVIYIFSFQGFN